MFIYFALWACMALFLTVSATKLALKRGQNPYFWALVTLLFGFFALAILYLLPIKSKEPEGAPALISASEISGPIPSNPDDTYSPSSPKDYRMWYYLNQEGKPIGPMTKKGLMDCLNQGQITRQSFIWSDHMTEWKKILDVTDMTGA